jgi:hypothetical protein
MMTKKIFSLIAVLGATIFMSAQFSLDTNHMLKNTNEEYLEDSEEVAIFQEENTVNEVSFSKEKKKLSSAQKLKKYGYPSEKKTRKSAARRIIDGDDIQ